MSNGQSNFQFFYAVAILVGMIVGAGTFGIPYVFSQAGFGVGFFYLAIISVVVLAVNLFYGETILRTQQPHHIVGYASKYLGIRFKKIVTAVILFEYYGALLVYLILGGDFLSAIFGQWLGGPDYLWVIVFFSAGAVGIFWRLGVFARNELIITVLLLAAVMVLIIAGLPSINLANFATLDLSKSFLPYGVILFAMAGSTAIPEMRQILRGQERKLKKAILAGTLIPAVLYFFFALVVVGVSGSQTSPEAIKGLAAHLGGWVIVAGAIFGILAVYTSFLVVGMATRRIYQQDYGVKKLWSFFLACVIPLAAYLAGLKNFIVIIGFVGAIFSGLDGILTILIYFRAKRNGDRAPEYRLPWARLLGILLILFFALGIIYQFLFTSGN